MSCIQRHNHPRWFVPTENKAGSTGLFIRNSLTSEKEEFVPANGKDVKMYVCGPTVYNSAHMGHARAYLTFDIIRRILSDYFGYNVFYQINITDIDDKIILTARKNELFRRYKESTRDFKVVCADAEAALQAARSKLEKKVADLKDDSINRTSREKAEQEELLKVAEMKLTQATESEEKLRNAIGSHSLDAVLEVSKDALCEKLDAEKGAEVNEKEIFDAHGRYFEKEFLEDCANLGVREPDVITRVTEFVPEVVAFIQKIIDEGFAYEANGSVYFNTQKFRTTEGHAYPKLVPSAGSGATDAEIAEGEGALATGESEKWHRNDFALWKAGKRGEPTWESPWSPGRPGWHIECSVMASDVLGSNFDIHGGGSDLKFPHHDNEMAQSEAHHGCQQWVNYFMHAGHLHIKGLKMSKSLKNFVTIRQALESHSARQVRLMFLMQPWDKSMNFSDQTIEAARKMEGRLTTFFAKTKEVARSEPVADRPQKWTAADRELSEAIAAAQRAVHEALCDNLDTPAAMRHLESLIVMVLAYASEGGAKTLLVRKAALFVQRMMSIFGVASSADAVGLTGGSGAERVEEVVAAFSSFRDELREFAQSEKNQKLLAMCDKLRDEIFVEMGVRLTDQADGPSQWSVENADDLRREVAAAREEKLAQVREKEVQKAKNKLGQLVKELARWEKALVRPQQFFTTAENEGVYAEFDDEGLPTKLANGEELSNKAKKQARKDLEKQTKDHEELMGAKGGPEFVKSLRQQVAALREQVAGA